MIPYKYLTPYHELSNLNSIEVYKRFFKKIVKVSKISLEEQNLTVIYQYNDKLYILHERYNKEDDPWDGLYEEKALKELQDVIYKNIKLLVN